MRSLALTIVLLAASGCGGEKSAPAADAASGLAKLAPADRALAEAQKVCPVTGEPLGSMGEPVRIEHEGTVVFLCCEHCKPKFEADPATYLAKIRK